MLLRPIEPGQYTSGQLARFARRHDIAQSVGRTGVCWDNAQAESFWSTLKSEFYHRYTWPTKIAARLAVGDWTERIYNRRRRHTGIGLHTPADVHYGLATDKAIDRRAVLDDARTRHPHRFGTTHAPKILDLPDTAWINRPADDNTEEIDTTAA